MIRVVLFGATRPNLVKIAALYHTFRADPAFEAIVVYANQHYDETLSGLLYRQLGLPERHVRLSLPQTTGAGQMTALTAQFRQYLEENTPDWVIVTGDVNATLAAARAAQQAGIPLAHVEAGLRSFDAGMPEEHNRIATDALARLHFVSEASGVEHLLREGYDPDGIHLVGNVMIDTLNRMLPAAMALEWPRGVGEPPAAVLSGPYFTATLHRPSNVDTPEALGRMLQLLRRLTALAPVIIPVHPRTAQRLQTFHLNKTLHDIPNLYATPPLGYLEFIRLMRGAALVLTDSGGIQEETTWLGIPCLTLRANTERPVTVDIGANVLAGDADPETILQHAQNALSGRWKKGRIPPLWDGHAAERILNILKCAQPIQACSVSCG